MRRLLTYTNMYMQRDNYTTVWFVAVSCRFMFFGFAQLLCYSWEAVKVLVQETANWSRGSLMFFSFFKHYTGQFNSIYGEHKSFECETNK